MPRTDDDSWDITDSVGATALGVAAARAAASQQETPLIADPFARVFLDAAGEGIWNMSGSSLPDELVEAEPNLPARMRAMVDYMACRTAFFDEFFLAAAAAGVRQVVILAAGLDARAWRLPWPGGTRVYELDQPKVLEFKSSTPAQAGAKPRSIQVYVPVDLRHDWPNTLQQSGFDESAPSAWSAEGLLMFLPARAQDLLFERIHTLGRIPTSSPRRRPMRHIAMIRKRSRAVRAAPGIAQPCFCGGCLSCTGAARVWRPLSAVDRCESQWLQPNNRGRDSWRRRKPAACRPRCRSR
jgi:methyltransferase (TIGR00027 family)